MIVLDEVPINVEDRALFNFLFKLFKINQSVTQNQVVEVSSTPFNIEDQNVNEQGSVYLVDATSGAVTINLPSAVGNGNRVFTVKKVDVSANAVTVDSVDDIDGGTVSLASQYDVTRVISDGTEWFTI